MWQDRPGTWADGLVSFWPFAAGYVFILVKGEHIKMSCCWSHLHWHTWLNERAQLYWEHVWGCLFVCVCVWCWERKWERNEIWSKFFPKSFAWLCCQRYKKTISSSFKDLWVSSTYLSMPDGGLKLWVDEHWSYLSALTQQEDLRSLLALTVLHCIHVRGITKGTRCVKEIHFIPLKGTYHAFKSFIFSYKSYICCLYKA